MELIIHDLTDNKLEKLKCEIEREEKIIDKIYESLAKLYSEVEKIIIISQCFYGSYSPFVKNVLDRTIPYLLPFFKIKNREMHHITRNKTKFNLNVYFYGKNLTQNERAVAKEIVKANSVNLDVKNFKVSFFEN